MASRLAYALVLFVLLAFVILAADPYVYRTELDAPVAVFKDGCGSSGKVVFAATTTGSLWRSDDNGVTWNDETTKLGTDRKAGVAQIYVSPVNPNVIWFVGGHNNRMWTSLDGGATYTFSKAFYDTPLTSFQIHPTRPAYAMGLYVDKLTSPGHCDTKLFVTKNYGMTWEVISSYVFDYGWGMDNANDPAPEPTIFVSHFENFIGHQPCMITTENAGSINLVKSDDLFESTTNVAKHGYNFQIFGNFLYAAVFEPSDTQANVHLYVSLDGGDSLFLTEVEGSLPQYGYFFADASEGAVFMIVEHDTFAYRSSSNLYLSDADGRIFALSLENIESVYDLHDFNKVGDLEGIYIANVYYPDDWYSKSYITFDKGGEWTHMRASSPQSCTNLAPKQPCLVHLQGAASSTGRLLPPSAPKGGAGLVVAQGNAGSSLLSYTDDVGLWRSHDGGKTWDLMAGGMWSWGFADHGNGLVIAPAEDAHVTQLQYSVDGGATFRAVTIEKSFTVGHVFSPADAEGNAVYIVGESDNVGIIITMDLTPSFSGECQGANAPNSQGSDYESWSPVSEEEGSQCALGHRLSYVRRKQGASCYSPSTFEPTVAVKHCQCLESDWECDFGYMRDTNGACVVNPEVPVEKPSCQPGQTSITITKGYRRVAGDTCQNGVDHSPEVLHCPGYVSSSSGVDGPSISGSTGTSSSTGSALQTLEDIMEAFMGTLLIIALCVLPLMVVGILGGLAFYMYKNDSLGFRTKLDALLQRSTGVRGSDLLARYATLNQDDNASDEDLIRGGQADDLGVLMDEDEHDDFFANTAASGAGQTSSGGVDQNDFLLNDL